MRISAPPEMQSNCLTDGTGCPAEAEWFMAASARLPDCSGGGWTFGRDQRNSRCKSESNGFPPRDQKEAWSRYQTVTNGQPLKLRVRSGPQWALPVAERFSALASGDIEHKRSPTVSASAASPRVTATLAPAFPVHHLRQRNPPFFDPQLGRGEVSMSRRGLVLPLVEDKGDTWLLEPGQ